MRKWYFLGLAMIFVISYETSAFAAMSNEELLKRLDDLTVIIQKQQEEIQKLRKEMESQKNRIDEVKETQQQDVQKAVKEQVKEAEKSWKDVVPGWVKRTKISGDLRTRYEGIYDRTQQEADGSHEDLANRDRYRIRARLYVDSDITDEIATHFMLTTDDDPQKDPTTSNQTLTDDFNDKGIYIGRAYASYLPNWLKGSEFVFGKFKNTFLHTDIMWDPDVNPEGAYEKYTYSGLDKFKPFVQLGQMSVNEQNFQTDDAYLFLNQAGFDWKVAGVTLTLAGSNYNWTNMENSKFLNRAQFKGGGGNTYKPDPAAPGQVKYKFNYNLWEGISAIKFDLGPVPTQLLFNYIVNGADNVPSSHDSAYYAGFLLGEEKKKGDWSFLYKYARIEQDAVIGSLNDQDFYGANRKGHKLMFRYLPFDRLTLSTSLFLTENIKDWDPNSPTFKNNDQNRGEETRLQVDAIFKF
jgi:Skp family chaperone for outer membrane proteins